MTLKIFIILACTGLAVSACVFEPYRGGRGYYNGDGGGHRYDDSHDYGRRVWRGE